MTYKDIENKVKLKWQKCKDAEATGILYITYYLGSFWYITRYYKEYALRLGDSRYGTYSTVNSAKTQAKQLAIDFICEALGIKE